MTEKRMREMFPGYSERHPVSADEAVSELARILADPNDASTDVELADRLGIPLSRISSLRSTPSFMEPVLQAFRRNLAAMSIDLIKAALKQAREGSSASTKLLLEATGFVSGTGGKTVVPVGSGTSHDYIGQLSDDDLDREITRLLRDVYPDDVVYSKGSLLTYSEIEVEDVAVDSEPGRDDLPIEAGEAVQASGGEAEEDVQ